MHCVGPPVGDGAWITRYSEVDGFPELDRAYRRNVNLVRAQGRIVASEKSARALSARNRQ